MLATIEFNHQNCCTFLPLIRYICAEYLIPFTLGSFLRVYLQALILGNYVSLFIMLIYLAHTHSTTTIARSSLDGTIVRLHHQYDIFDLRVICEGHLIFFSVYPIFFSAFPILHIYVQTIFISEICSI